MDLENIINKAWSNRDLLKNELTVNAIEKVITKLDAGELRVAEKINNKWETNQWIKKAVVLYFPIRKMETIETKFPYVHLKTCIIDIHFSI